MTKFAPRLGDKDWLEDESFENQMEALGVEIVKPEVKWYKPDLAKGQRGLYNRISINKSCVTLGRVVVEKIGADKVAVGIIKNTKGEPVMALRASKKGMKITKTSGQSYRLGTQRLVRWLLEQKIELGIYELKETKDGSGYLAYKI